MKTLDDFLNHKTHCPKCQRPLPLEMRISDPHDTLVYPHFVGDNLEGHFSLISWAMSTRRSGCSVQYSINRYSDEWQAEQLSKGPNSKTTTWISLERKCPIGAHYGYTTPSKLVSLSGSTSIYTSIEKEWLDLSGAIRVSNRPNEGSTIRCRGISPLDLPDTFFSFDDIPALTQRVETLLLFS